MTKMVILGAGASYGCSWAKTENRPPLLKDLHTIVEKTNRLYGNKNEEFVHLFNDLYNNIIVNGDFELYCTALYYLEKVRVKEEPKYAFFYEDTIKRILSQPEIIKKHGVPEEYSKICVEMLKYSIGKAEFALLYLAYHNFVAVFSSKLRDFFYACHGGNIGCDYHAKIFSHLNEKDIVVSFNYDEIADYTLLNAKKLSKESLEDLGFTGVHIARDYPDGESVKLLKLHGSFNWNSEPITESDIEELILEYPDYEKMIDKVAARTITHKRVHYNLMVQGWDDNSYKGEIFPVVFPLHTKKEIYDNFSILSKHHRCFCEWLSIVDEIWLVGKTFMNNDCELQEEIRDSCCGYQKALYLINPASNDEYFIDFHEKLFNGITKERWSALDNYYYDKRI